MPTPPCHDANCSARIRARRECDAHVLAIDERGIRLDRTVFYPQGGGRPATRRLLLADGATLAIADTRKGDAPGEICHVPAPGQEAAARRAAAGSP
jgi:misacylated tRNA(Ala) deacylase